MKAESRKKVGPPTIETAKAFGSNVEPVLLSGGRGTSYHSGNIVLKPAGKGPQWRSEIFNTLTESSSIRFHRPVRAANGTWEYGGYVAWYFLEGEHVKGRYEEKLKASRELHKLLKGIPKPESLNAPKGSWSAGNWVALGQKDFDYDKEFMDLYDQIKPHLKPLPEDRQLVHGDMGGNFLFHETLPPAMIDFSGVWAPDGFGEGVMLADAITWENASPQELEVFKSFPNIEQMAWRGVLTRIAEQAEHIIWFGKNKQDAVKEARAFQKAIDYLNNNF